MNTAKSIKHLIFTCLSKNLLISDKKQENKINSPNERPINFNLMAYGIMKLGRWKSKI